MVSGLDEFEFVYSVCQPRTKASCYTGPAGTENVGLCQAGEKVCNAAGDGYGPCTGDVGPALADDCVTGLDGDCNGLITSAACEGKASGSSFGGQGALLATNNASLPNGELLLAGSFTYSFPFAGQTLPQLSSTTGFVGRFDASGAPAQGMAISTNGQATDIPDVAGSKSHIAAIVTGSNNPFPAATVDLEVRVWPLGADPESAAQTTVGRVNTIGQSSESTLTPVGLVAAGEDEFVVGITNAGVRSLKLGSFSFTGSSYPDVILGGLAKDGSFSWAFSLGKDVSGEKKITDLAMRGEQILLGLVSSGAIDLGCGIVEGEGPLAIAASFDVSESPPRCLWSKGFTALSDRGPYASYEPAYTDVAFAPNGDAWMAFSSNADLPELAGDAANGGEMKSAVIVGLGQTGSPDLAIRLRSDAGSVEGQRIAIDPFGNIVFGGCFQGKITWGSENRSAPNAQQACDAIYLAKMGASGAPIWLRSFVSDGNLGSFDLSIGPSAMIHASATLFGRAWFDTMSGDPFATEQSGGALRVRVTP